MSSAASSGLTKLDHRTTLLGIIGELVLTVGSPTATTTMASAASNGLEKADDETLYCALTQFLCTTAGCNIDTTSTTSIVTNHLAMLQSEQVWTGILQVVLTGTVTTAVNTANTLGYSKLQDRELIVSIAQLVINGATPFSTLVATSTATGWFKLSRAILMAVLLELFCEVYSLSATFHILTETGSNIAAETGALLRTE